MRCPFADSGCPDLPAEMLPPRLRLDAKGARTPRFPAHAGLLAIADRMRGHSNVIMQHFFLTLGARRSSAQAYVLLDNRRVHVTILDVSLRISKSRSTSRVLRLALAHSQVRARESRKLSYLLIGELVTFALPSVRIIDEAPIVCILSAFGSFSARFLFGRRRECRRRPWHADRSAARYHAVLHVCARPCDRCSGRYRLGYHRRHDDAERPVRQRRGQRIRHVTGRRYIRARRFQRLTSARPTALDRNATGRTRRYR